MNGATEAKRIKREYDERDPVRLCAAMGILLRFAPMGTNARSCKGFYLYQCYSPAGRQREEDMVE
ncbi:hypothetical protein FACS1894184_09050 [Clostridia bacterium]|nr:hypothetical protein FACS1894184_09050 [Clostridia bacterium]